jgi:hypothetical protein
VEARFNEKTEQFIEENLDLAMSKDPKANDWRKTDISKFFAQERGVLPALVDSAKQNFSADANPAKPAPVVTSGTAAPRSSVDAQKTSPAASEDEVKKFLESLPATDRKFIGAVFSDKGEAAKTALSEARNAWKAMQPNQRAAFRDETEYASAMVFQASKNGSAVHG